MNPQELAHAVAANRTHRRLAIARRLIDQGSTKQIRELEEAVARFLGGIRYVETDPHSFRVTVEEKTP